MAQGLNTDFSRFVVMHTDAMEWQASPSKGVWRKRLDLAGDPEKSRVTSVVRYDAASRFPPHPHPDGEEMDSVAIDQDIARVKIRVVDPGRVHPSDLAPHASQEIVRGARARGGELLECRGE